jgi:hypothetical protein
MAKYAALYSALLIAATSLTGSSPARAAGGGGGARDTVEIYSAGSLRGVVGDVAKEAASAGAGAKLQKKARALMNVSATPSPGSGQSAAARAVSCKTDRCVDHLLERLASPGEMRCLTLRVS